MPAQALLTVLHAGDELPPSRSMPTLPTIYYICHVPPSTGGERVNLQHVASLAGLGMRAVALVNAASETDQLRLPYEVLAPGRQFSAADIVVIPEFYRDAFRHFATTPCRRIIHNQGPFLSFRGYDSIAEMNTDGLSAGLTCSNFGRHLMQRMGSDLEWHIVTPFLPAFFSPDASASAAPRKLQIAYMPDKRPREAPVIKALFQHRYPGFAHVAWVPITNVSRQRCAEIMAESAVFASLSWLDGLGLPPLEAMASGCLVYGFDGHGGSDFATPDNGLWIAEGDHDAFADALARSLTMAQDGAVDGERQRRISAGRATATAYSRERFDVELHAAWRTILGPAWGDYCQP